MNKMDIAFLFDQVYRYKKISSTYDKAKNYTITKKGKGHFLIIAESQSAGKGRNNNIWYSPEGGLWVTAAFYNIPLKNCVTIFSALMIIKAITKIYKDTDTDIGLKWPNDIILAGKKLGGILTTFCTSTKYLIMGVGINTNNSIIDKDLDAISLKDYYRQQNYEDKSNCITTKHKQLDENMLMDINNEELLYEIFANFFHYLPQLVENDLKPFCDDYYRFSILENKNITLSTQFQDYQGIVKGINKDGAILLKHQSNSIQPFFSGSVRIKKNIDII